MSLVYEALRKAEREKERKTSVAPEPRPTPSPSPNTAGQTTTISLPTGSSATNKLFVGSLLVIAVLLSVVMGWVVWNTVNSHHRLDAQAPVQAGVLEPMHVETSPPPPPPAAITENDSRFKLTGIMGKPDGGFGAIINGRAVYEGQYIDGAIVKKITRDRVTLDFNGREIVVRLASASSGSE